MKHHRIVHTVLGVIVSLSTADFIEVQKLSPEELRARFKLPAACNPAVTAMTSDTSGNRLTVAIECRPGALDAVPARASGDAPGTGDTTDGSR
ncbi:MAG TPA: hypothetical protein VGL09_01555 [Methylomirabilota bacterium]